MQRFCFVLFLRFRNGRALYTELRLLWYIRGWNDAIWRVSDRVKTDNLDKHLIHLNPNYL